MKAAPNAPEMKVALWALNHAHRVAGAAQWIDLLARQMESAASSGCHVLVLPEYTSAHWLHWADGPLSGQALMRWMADQGEILIPEMEALARKFGVGLVVGCVAHSATGAGIRNRAWVFLPDGKGGVSRRHHDKLAATPSERPEGDWPIECGRSIDIVEWRGWKLAVLICLDVEQPGIIARLQGEGVDLVIVPSMTSYLAGYRRVFDCAKAAAIELFSAVAAVGGIGELAWNAGPNCSGAALYVPCEAELASIGCLAAIGPFTTNDGPGPVLLVSAPVARIRELRARGPEAWPGPFDGGGLTINRESAAS